MALPTLQDVRAAAIAWFTEPGTPRLPVLRARLSSLVTPPESERAGVSVDVLIEPTPTLIVVVSRWNMDGSITHTQQLEWSPGPNDRAGFELHDCIGDGDKRSIRESMDDRQELRAEPRR